MWQLPSSPLLSAAVVVVMMVLLSARPSYSFQPSSKSRVQQQIQNLEGVTSSEDQGSYVEEFIIPDPPMSRKSFFATAATMAAMPTVAKAAPPTSQLASSSSLINAAAEASAIQESISGFFAGAALTVTKTLVKFPLDTATVRLQIPNSKYSVFDPSSLFQGSYNGVTLSLLSNIPGGAIFFAVKDATKASLKQSALTSAAPRWVTTCLAVAAAQIPYWMVRNPSEVVKVRQQAGVEGYGDGVNAWDAVRQTMADAGSSTDNNTSVIDGLKEFYTGYWENILYAYPADVIKFVAYESISKGRKDLSPMEGATAGALATAIAQFVTTPLDVVRNRLMTGKDRSGSPLSAEEKNKNYIESLSSLAKKEGLKGLFAGASPRVGKAILSGAIQFATYEETKKKIGELLQGGPVNRA